jgi:hypothetical protein
MGKLMRVLIRVAFFSHHVSFCFVFVCCFVVGWLAGKAWIC